MFYSAADRELISIFLFGLFEPRISGKFGKKINDRKLSE